MDTTNVRNSISSKLKEEESRSSSILKYIQFPIETEMGVLTIDKSWPDSSFPVLLNGEFLCRISASYGVGGLSIFLPKEIKSIIEVKELQLEDNFKLYPSTQGSYVESKSNFWEDIRKCIDTKNVFCLPNCMDTFSISQYAKDLWDELPSSTREALEKENKEWDKQEREDYNNWKTTHEL